MKTTLLILSVLLTTSAATAADGVSLVTNCAEVTRILRDEAPVRARFELTVRAVSETSEFGRGMMVADASGATILGRDGALKAPPPVRNGDLITVTGRICTPPGSGRFTRAEKIVLLEHGAPYVPPTLTPDEFARRRGDYSPVRLRGIVRNLIFDEIDPHYTFLVLEGHQAVAYVACRAEDGDRTTARRLIGAEIAATGVREMTRTNRKSLGPDILSFNNKIEILRPPPADPFAAPSLGELAELSPLEVARSGPHRTRGTVLAVWQKTNLLLRREDGGLTRAELADEPAPVSGAFIEIVGSPAADSYHLNLVRAQWRAADGTPSVPAAPRDVRASNILSSVGETRVIRPDCHGELLRVTGTVVDRTGAAQFCLHDGTGLVTVDFGPCGPADWSVGSTVRATGICVMDIPAWQPHETFPQIRGYRLVARRADDLRLVARPPWWTPGRTWTALGLLAALALGCLVWSLSLRVLAERRGRELLREQIASVKSRLKVEERTRLAVELHDSLSQTLTGVSMEISAADDLKGDAPSEMSLHLSRANRALASCRTELKNCLWDLRSEALDEPDLTRAILRTLQPHADKTKLSVRFNVPRANLSDNTAHTLLSILRELVVNALRHGKASSVKVAGSRDADGLHFSVCDNGCGFDPDDCPGVLEGHFGLEGIRERIGRLGGTLTVESAPGRGTRVTGHLPSHARQPTLV